MEGNLDAARVIDWEQVDRSDGRDDMNLAEFPLAVLSTRVPRGVKTLEFLDTIYDRGRGEHISRKVLVTGSDRFGLPTCQDEEVFLGLIQYTKLANGFSSPDVWFSQSELLRLIDWAPNGENYRRLKRAFQRLKGLTLYCQNAWWDKRTESWQTFDEGIGILEYYKLYDARRRSKSSPVQLDLPLPRSQYIWNRILFESFASGYLKKLDFEFWLQLENAIAKRMYRFLDKRFYRNARVELELRNFACEHVGLSRKYDTGKLKEKLRPGIEELEGTGYLIPVPRKDRYKKIEKGVWHILLERKEDEPAAKTVQEGPGDDKKKVSSGLEDRLVQFRVSRGRARELSAKYEPRIVEETLEYVAWKNARVGRDEQPLGGGFVIRAIELHAVGDFVFDEGFRTTGEQEATERRRADERAKRAHETQKARAEVKAYREKFSAMKSVVEKHLAGLSEGQRQELDKVVLGQALAGERMIYRSSELTRVELLHKHLAGVGEIKVSPGNKSPK